MVKKIKNYMNKPLTMGWLWKWSIISFILSAILCVTYYKVDVKQLFKPSDDWEDIPEEE